MSHLLSDMSKVGENAGIEKKPPLDSEFLEKLKILTLNKNLIKFCPKNLTNEDIAELRKNSNFKIRDENFYKHELSDKLIMIDKVEQNLHNKLDSFILSSKVGST